MGRLCSMASVPGVQTKEGSVFVPSQLPGQKIDGDKLQIFF